MAFVKFAPKWLVLGGSLELGMATHFLSFGVTELCANPNSTTYWCMMFFEFLASLNSLPW